MLRSLISASVRFRFLLIAVAAGIMALAVATVPGIHADVLPETAPVTARIQTEAPGLSAPEVESLVTVPLEKNLLEGVMGVTDVTSDSIPGLSQINLDFAPGTNLYQARQLVQERLTQAFVLPNVSKPPVLLQPVSSTGNVMLIGLTSRQLSQIDLSVLARWTIVPRLLGVSGVADVAAFGEADRQLQVLVDPARLAARHITLAQIIETAGNAQLVSPLSYLEGSTPGTGGFLEGPNQRITIEPVLPFGTPANLGQVPVTETSGPKPVPLGSVTDIVVGHQPLIGDALVRGQPGLVLVVQKLPSASVPAMTDGLNQALAQLAPSLSGVQVDTTLFRPASYIDNALNHLSRALIAAAILAALALIALLLNLRLAVVALTATAISLTAGTVLLYLLGYTFNALVTLGLLLALAVVAAEAAGTAKVLASLRRAEPKNGSRPSGADLAVAGCGELRGPLCAAALAVLAAAAPVALIPGLTGTFLRPMVLAFMLSVAASTVVALTVTPALAALLLGGGRRGREPRDRASWAGRAYQATLRGVLRVPRLLAAAVCLGGVSLAGAAAVTALPSIHPARPQFQDRNLVIRWTGVPGMSLPELDRLAARTSQQLTALPVVGDVAATVGRAVSSDQIVSTNSAEIWVTIRPGAAYDGAVGQVRAIADGMPGVAGTVSTYESDSMGGVLAAAPRALTVRLYGSDYGELARLGRQVEAVMARISGLGPPQMQLPASQPTLNVAVNLPAATRNGVKPGDIRREAATLLSGLTVGNFFEQQKVFDVVVQGTPAVRSSLASVSDLLLDTVNGGHARLSALARVSVAAEPADIPHEATSPYLDVTARLSGRSLGSARAAVATGLRGISFPLTYYAAVQAPSLAGPADQAVFGWRLASYVIAALIGILLLAQAATGSWRLALLMLAALPVPVAAGLLTAFRLGTQDSLAALAGLLGVLAVAIHQAFRVTAAIRRAHLADGGPLTPGLAAAAAAEAAGPILTAALVAAVALVPFIAAGQVAGNELPHAAAPVILAGLIAATLLNTLVLPAACVWFGPARAPQDLPVPPDAPPDVPQPREEPEVPSVAAQPENPVS